MRDAVGLRSRFIFAGALLVATTVATSLYSAWAFSRLGEVVDLTVRDSERTTEAAGDLISALEREDDALLLTATDSERGRRELVSQRRSVSAALRRFEDLLTLPEREGAASHLAADVDGYHSAGNILLETPRPETARALYHSDVNPLLRRAVGAVAGVREHHLRSTNDAARWARDQARRSNRILLGVSVASLLLSILVSLYLAKVVVTPIGELTGAVEAMRQGDFDLRLTVDRRDEIGRLTDGFNLMADDLAAFRRANIGEVIRAKETLEATLAALPDAVLVIEPEGEISSANPRAGEIMNTFTFSANRSVQELPLPEATKEAVRALLRGGATAARMVDFSTTIPMKVGGEERRLLPRVVPVEGGPGRRRGAVLVLSDVTDLARLDEMRMELVAVVSHELRTPLTTLRMTLLMLQEHGDRLHEHERSLLETALIGVEQLSDTITEFLDLTQIEAGQLRLQRDRIDVEGLLIRTLRTMESACRESEIKMSLDIGPNTPRSIFGDAGRLSVVLSNVLRNAVKYAPRGTAISVATSSDQSLGQSWLRTEIADTGPGVEAEFRERVFDKFFRVEHQRPERNQGVRGSGIGLYIAREIVRAHGGTIACLAGPDDRGARFVISLPAVQEQAGQTVAADGPLHV